MFASSVECDLYVEFITSDSSFFARVELHLILIKVINKIVSIAL